MSMSLISGGSCKDWSSWEGPLCQYVVCCCGISSNVFFVFAGQRRFVGTVHGEGSRTLYMFFFSGVHSLLLLFTWTLGGTCTEGSGHQGARHGSQDLAEVLQRPGTEWCWFDDADPVLYLYLHVWVRIVLVCWDQYWALIWFDCQGGMLTRSMSTAPASLPSLKRCSSRMPRAGRRWVWSAMVAGLRVTFWPRNWRGGHMAHKIQNGYGVSLCWISKSGVGSGEKGNLNEVGHGEVQACMMMCPCAEISLAITCLVENWFDFTAVGVQPASKLCAMQQGQRRGIRLSAREASFLLAIGLPTLVTFGCIIQTSSGAWMLCLMHALDQDSSLRFCGWNLWASCKPGLG